MKKIVLFGFMLLIFTISKAQINYTFAASSGTYTSISGGTTATLVANDGVDPASDEGHANNIPIGFTFNFNGFNYTQLHVNSNGFIALGAIFTVDPNETYYYNDLTSGPSSLATARPLIAPLWDDLDIANVVYSTTGSSPNRVTTIEWLNAKWRYNATAAGISFQAKLYEGTNKIDFIYRQEAGVLGASPSASIGLAASATGTNNFISLDGSGAAPLASKTTETTTIATKPATGQIYTFTPVAQAANDVSVNLVYALGKAGKGVANSVKANISNLGTAIATNKVVTLTVSGANTYTNSLTVTSLASGASGTLSFPNFILPIVGTNTITVSVANDDNNTNNTVSTIQETTTNQLNYGVGTTVVSGINAGTGNEIAAKFGVHYPAKIATVDVYFFTAGNTYDLIIYNNVAGLPGIALGTLTGQTTTLGLNTITLPTPVSVSDSFYVSFKQTGTNLPVSYQTESPLRTNAFYLKSGVNPWFDLSGNAGNIYRLMIGLTTVNALPLELLSFNGQLKNGNAILNWSTSSEINVDRFEIERSNSSSSWSSIATVSAKGASSNTYQATDANLAAGKWNYRLKMIDRDGKFSYSQIVSLELNGKGQFVLNQNYPNPVKGTTQLSYQVSADAKVMIELLANDGKKIATLVNQQQGIGSYNVTVDLAKYGLAAGNYMYRMIALGKNNEELFQSTKTITVVQ